MGTFFYYIVFMINPEQINGKFKCTTCGKLFSIMWGNTCNKCRQDEIKYEELVKQIKTLTKKLNMNV